MRNEEETWWPCWRDHCRADGECQMRMQARRPKALGVLWTRSFRFWQVYFWRGQRGISGASM